MSAPDAPGWFGKIPALGDFATRRLPVEFTDIWDAWLANGLEASQDELGDDWADVYRSAPLWRFALAPGVIDEQFWFGVLLPSIDRVGRLFPLTIATASEAPPTPPWTRLEQWYEQVSVAALDCVSRQSTVETFEASLAGFRLAFDFAGDNVVDDDGVLARLPAAGGLEQALTAGALPLLARELHGTTFWWACNASADAPLVMLRGLPDATHFAALLQGSL